MSGWRLIPLLLVLWLSLLELGCVSGKRHRSPRAGRRSILRPNVKPEDMNSIDFIWSTQTVAAGDTAVLHCSFDAIFSQLRNGNIDWFREPPSSPRYKEAQQVIEGREARDVRPPDPTQPVLVATGKKVVTSDKRVRVYRPHNSALSVLIIRRAKKRDAGIFRCNLSGSSTRHKFMVLNVTESKIEAKISPQKLRTRIGKDVTLWCNATGYPTPMVYWTREDSHRQLQDGTYQYWGNALNVIRPTEVDTGVYSCYVDNFVHPVVSYKFSLFVEDTPWDVDAFKMRFDSSSWFPGSEVEPKPVRGMSYLLMCETRGAPKPLPHVRWFRNGKTVHNNRHFYIIEDRPEWKNSYTSSTLVIMRFVPRFRANYTCSASNVFRVQRQTFELDDYYEKPPVNDITSINHKKPVVPEELSAIRIDHLDDTYDKTEDMGDLEDDDDDENNLGNDYSKAHNVDDNPDAIQEGENDGNDKEEGSAGKDDTDDTVDGDTEENKMVGPNDDEDMQQDDDGSAQEKQDEE